MEKETITPENTPSSNIASLGPSYKGTKAKESDRKGKTTEMAVSPFYSPQERTRERQTHPRPLSTEQVHSLSKVQDADPESSKTTTSKRLLDSKYRLSRRLLALTNNTGEETLPRVCVQRSGLAVPSSAFRSKCWSQSIHQGHISCHQAAVTDGHMVFAVSRRPTHNSQVKRGMYPTYANSPEGTTTIGFSDKRKEVSFGSCSSIRLAGSTLEPYYTHSPNVKGKSSATTLRSEVVSSIRSVHKKNDHGATGQNKLGGPIRPRSKAHDEYHKTHAALLQTSQKRRFATNTNEFPSGIMQRATNCLHSSENRLTCPFPNHSNRCFTPGLGYSNKSDVPSWNLGHVHEVLNECPGTFDNLSRPIGHRKKGPCHTNTMRQQDSCVSFEERRLSELHSKFVNRINNKKSSKTQLDSSNSSHQRIIQCVSRPVVEKGPTVNGMVDQLQGFSENSETEPCLAGRSVCDTPEQQITSLHIPVSGSEGGSSGCHFDHMESVATPIRFSTNTTDPKSSGKTGSDAIPECHTGDTGNATTAMVHGSQITQDSFDPPASSPITESPTEDSDPNTTYKTPRVDFVRRGYQSRYPECHRTVELLSKPLCTSSLSAYNSQWKSFCTYLEQKNILLSEVTINTVLAFFTFLFDVKGLRPTTIAKYRAALTVPLELHFNIDLRQVKTSEAISTLFRAMRREKPDPIPTPPNWSLNKVLTYIDETHGYMVLETLLQKTAFLLLLATGWRISELHACVRDRNYCFISNTSTLMIRSHPTFLAKNEKPDDRWAHTKVNNLTLQDNSVSNLCPVQAIQDYLRRTSRVTSGPLFIHPSTQKPLTVSQLSSYVCKFIAAAEPGTRATVHQIRKVAANCSLAQTFNVSDMVSAMRWRSPATFWRSYMVPIEPLIAPVILPGTVGVPSC